jgi:hypothetical protein
VRSDRDANSLGYRSPTPYDNSGAWPMQSPSQTGRVSTPGYTGSLEFGTPSDSALRHQHGMSTGSNSASSLPGAPSLLSRRPRRAPDVRDLMTVVTTYNLTRSHRTMLLLADGEHTVLDLARLSSKSVDEISMLLSELEARNLVYYYQQ